MKRSGQERVVSDLAQLLRKRASLTREVRHFFHERNVLEVTSPLLSQAAVTEVNIESFGVSVSDAQFRYLRTSPEFSLKRFLSAGAPDLYELGPVFRQGESGRWHNPEFTLLEWYRLGFSMQSLIDEVVALLGAVGDARLQALPVRQLTYYEAIEQAIGADVRSLGSKELSERVAARLPVPEGDMDVDQWLDYAFSALVQPGFDNEIVVVTHYPATQAALAKLAPDGNTALRFEVFVGAIELANGFEELTDAAEQAARFEQDNRLREQRGLPRRPVDTRFLDALSSLPACSGVALGFDRLLMTTQDIHSMDRALALPWSVA